MFGRLGTLLPLLLCLWALLVQPTSSSPTLATQVVETETATRSDQLGGDPPPLTHTCGGMATDYNQPVCCVSGYVYQNGEPVAGATVTVTANGQEVDVLTEEDDHSHAPDDHAPHFGVSLSELLEVQPGQEVTMTATFEGVSSSLTFTANPGSQQQDIVLPSNSLLSEWQRVDLSKRFEHAMAYDGEDVILFGGWNNHDDNGHLNDTWRWDGERWTIAMPTLSPPSRYKHAMAYNSNRDRIVLFGGYQDSNNRLNDTWEWDGNTWIEHLPSTSPEARTSYAMVYDGTNDKIVLFGGNDGDNYFSDTWVWNGDIWADVTPSTGTSPSARVNHAMAYDETTGNVVLFGGYDGTTQLDDTWIWDGQTWTEKNPSNSPSSRYQHTMEYHTATGQVVLFGGFNGSYLNDTWKWDGTTWTEGEPENSPQARRGHDMASDGQHIVLFGGDTQGLLGDTWEWNGDNWLLQAQDGEDSPPARKGAALSYESGGQSLLFGGTDDSSWDDGTYRWADTSWNQLNPATSPVGREGHRLTRNTDGSQLLLFGGIDSESSYLNDTWLWDGTNWQEQSPTLMPSARAGYGLTYDSQRNVWLLFGGQNASSYLADLWQYNGTSWTQIQSNSNPSARSDATLTYDSSRGRAVLIGGRDENNYLNEVWEWDGTDWQNVTPNNSPPARAYHEAAYLTIREVVVIAGGLGNSGALTDTWEWNGTEWEQHITSSLAMYNFAMTYDLVNDRLIAFGGQNTSTLIDGTYLYNGTSLNALPIATINYINPRDARQESDEIIFEGSGADGDGSNQIESYRWMLNSEVISQEARFTVAASTLPTGTHTISFAVQDDEGTWSDSIQRNIIIRSGEGGTWTHLIYAVADNDLDHWMGDYSSSNGMLYRLRRAGAQDNVQVGILYDGPDIGDTRRYILAEDGTWTEEKLEEALMDEMATLRDFIQWGYNTFESDYYALSLVDHANGIVGFGEDRSTNTDGSEFLTPRELREALRLATNDGEPKIDVLHYDGCSFGLLEDAAISRGLAQYVVASPNTGWGIFSYKTYRERAANLLAPKSYAKAIAEEYASDIEHEGFAYTISVFDMSHFEELNEAVSILGDSLLAYVDIDPSAHRGELRTIRDASQKYDSGGNIRIEIDNEDSYVDLVDLVSKLQEQIDDQGVDDAAATVENAIKNSFVIYEAHKSGPFYYDQTDTIYDANLSQAYGLGIFYPPRANTDSGSAYLNYVQNDLFDITSDWGWTRFLAQGIPAQGGGDPPGLTDHELIPHLIPQVEYQLFLPSIQR